MSERTRHALALYRSLVVARTMGWHGAATLLSARLTASNAPN